jgi:glutamate formiminotransferase
VVTLVGDERSLETGLVAGVQEAGRAINLRHHEGVHPRVGAADVVPVVPLGEDDLPRAIAVAQEVARRIGEDVGVPVFFYGVVGEGRRPAFFRGGGPAGLQRRIDSGELAPAYGPRRLDPRSGAVLVGVRPPLLAFNLELLGTLDTARAVAAAVRESSGGLKGVQALGLALGVGAIQVSTNIVDLDATAPHVLVERVVSEARARGASVGRGELVGLLPAASVAQAARATGIAHPLDSAGIPTAAALDAAGRALHLDHLDADRVLEWHLPR